MKKHSLLLLLIVFIYAGCKTGDDTPPDPTFRVVEISTDFGDMYVWLYPETPLHQANFEKLIAEDFYDDTEFHRIIPNFVIQGGDPNSKDSIRSNDGSGGPGYTIDAEIDSTKFKHHFGALGAARLGNSTNPERASSGSQFYIVTDLDGAHFLDGEYTVFGEVLKGMDVATTIQSQPRNNNDLPNDRLKMTMSILQKTKAEFEAIGISIP